MSSTCLTFLNVKNSLVEPEQMPWDLSYNLNDTIVLCAFPHHAQGSRVFQYVQMLPISRIRLSVVSAEGQSTERYCSGGGNPICGAISLGSCPPLMELSCTRGCVLP